MIRDAWLHYSELRWADGSIEYVVNKHAQRAPRLLATGYIEKGLARLAGVVSGTEVVSYSVSKHLVR